jgi:hypothetical protein
MSCPVCGSERAGCPNLKVATPEPNRWCPELEDTLEARDWRQWAQRYREAERHYPPGYRTYRQPKFAQWRQAGRVTSHFV